MRKTLSAVTRAVSCAMALALAGCATFEKTQSDAFIDDDSNVVFVDYGRRSKDHVFMVRSPGNGKLVEYTSNLMVKFTLPDGRRLTGYRTLNTMPVGTMYMTDDEEWIYLTNGLMCRIYLRTADGLDYLRVYEGNLTKSKDDKK